MKTLSTIIRKIIVGVYLWLFKTETSKWILRFCDGALAASLIATYIGWYQCLDVSYVVQIIQPLCGLCAAAHGFYFWKAKIENCRKYPDVMEVMRMNGVNPMNDGTQY